MNLKKRIEEVKALGPPPPWSCPECGFTPVGPEEPIKVVWCDEDGNPLYPEEPEHCPRCGVLWETEDVVLYDDG